ncbi:lytic transglycosylase domain-containing protein [Myroides pelagicus]|uniref:Transglycosylase SLT domain-containing protein n=1 Tax=Myroides pelagicus TaxID=270914 RepID=A0A7K1GM97_9FLAO|nr:lytic transglycosylase domain-containing protein [Myroides pelagicus]MEC4114346.1 transglycosylase SLT domain-containing protein [Myroides pelagicus]MTH29870.1 transglycosylase SLT domain-containing protein [Myroides pelagicus]
MKKTITTTLSILAVVAVSSTFIFSASHDTAKADTPVEENLISPHLHAIPSKINFAGEETPLHIPDVKERFEREMIVNTNLHGSTLLTIKRAGRYFPIIEPILAKNGIPDDFKYLCVIESALSNAVSPAGASGFWQFMKGTAKDYGLVVDETIDERYDLIKATEAACNYLNDAKAKFGSWTLVAASYNRGMAGINRALDNQYVDNYYDLFLNQETSRYVFRMLALKEIMSNADKYGFAVPVNLTYKNIKTKKVAVDYDIADLPLFAKEQGVNYKLLKLHNPWLVSSSFKPKGQTYYMEIPIQ